MNLFKRNVDIIKDILIEHIKEGDIVVDCTMGNGHDTLFLASRVGDKGKVYSFDIQELALENTKKLLRQNDYDQKVELIKDGHENIDKYIKEPITAFIYNLGYLPKADENIVTKKETTISSLEKATKMLTKSGVVAIISYYGHEGGIEEKDAVDKFAKNLNDKSFTCIKLQTYNRGNYPPILYIIKKMIS